MSSHMFKEVERTCASAGIIREGKLVSVDTVEDLRKRHIHSYTITLANKKQQKHLPKILTALQRFDGHGCYKALKIFSCITTGEKE